MKALEIIPRWGIALISWGVVLFLSFALVGWLSSAFNFALMEWLNPTLAIAVWIFVVARTYQQFMVYVPEVTGLLALSALTGELNAFGPGLHWKYPWEAIREENFFPLELKTERHEEDYVSQDGRMMLTKWSYQYETDGNNLESFIKVDHSTIDEGFQDIISGILSEVIGGMIGADARTHVKEVQDQVLAELSTRTAPSRGIQTTLGKKLENQYGVNFRLFALADIDFSKDYQEALSGRARMQVIKETALELKDGLPDVSDQEAANFILVEQRKATKHITEVTDLAEAANALGRGLRGLGGE